MNLRPQNRFTERNMVFRVVTTRVNQLAILSRVSMGATKTTQHFLGSSILMFKVLCSDTYTVQMYQKARDNAKFLEQGASANAG